MRQPALVLAALSLLALSAVGPLAAVEPESLADSVNLRVKSGVPEVPAAPQCAGGLQNDDGTVENGYSFNAGNGILDGAHFAERYDPGAGLFRFSQVCVCLTGLGVTTSAPVEVVFFADGGGQPGAEIARVEANATGIPTYPATAFFDVPVQVDTDGPVWVAASWNVDTHPQVFVCADENGPGGAVPGMTTIDGGTTWDPLTTYWPQASAVFVRAEAAPAPSALEIPTLGIAGLAALALLLGLLSFLLLRRRPA